MASIPNLRPARSARNHKIPKGKPKTVRYRMAERFRLSLQRILHGMSLAERWLTAALASYVFTAVTFFSMEWRREGHVFIRYVVTLASLALALVIPEITRSRRRTLRLILMGIPTLVLGFLQVENEVRILDVGSRLTAAQLQHYRDIDVRELEARSSENVVLDPKGALLNGEWAGEGFQVKGNERRVLVFEREARLLVDHPELAEVILNFPEGAGPKLRAYDHLAAVQPGRAAAISDVVQLLREQVAYGSIADLFRREITPKYRKLEAAINHNKLTTSEVCEQLSKIVDSLRQAVVLYPVAGLYNHIGTMVLSCARPEEALGLFYAAVAADDTHFTAFESLSYGLWIINKDSQNALKNAELGLGLCKAERNAVENSFLRATQMYDSFVQGNRSYALLVSRRINTLKPRAGPIQNDWGDFVDDLTRRLTNSFSYYSALELKNEEQARKYMTELYESNPNAADYQDSLGFVLMRFARDEAELERAERLFTQAIQNQNADPETPRLASVHLQELQAYRRHLHGRSEPIVPESTVRLDERAASL